MWVIKIVYLHLPTKWGFHVIRVICHESVIHVTGLVSQESEAQGLLPLIALQDSQKHSFLALVCGGCALTFAEILFLCIWFSQLYML